MLLQHVSCQYLVTSVTSFRSVLVDLSRSRTVHSTEHEPCCPDPVLLSSEECRAVHYGLCSPLLKLPSFSILPSGDLVPSSSIRHTHNSKKVTFGIQSSESAHSKKYESRKCYNEVKRKTSKPLKSSQPLITPSTEENESVEHLAANLQKHLGDFLTAFMKSENVNKIAERNKCDAEELMQCVSKETFLSSLSKRKPTPLGQDVLDYKAVEENVSFSSSTLTTNLPRNPLHLELNLHPELSKANKGLRSVVDDIIASLRDVEDAHNSTQSSQTDKAIHSLKNGFRSHTVEKSTKKSSVSLDSFKDIVGFDQQFNEIITKSKFSQELLPSLPHPELFYVPKQLKRPLFLSDAHLSFQPIKTVTERVLASEKCPDWTQERISEKARSHQQASARKLSLRTHKEKENVDPSSHLSIKQHQYYNKLPSSSVYIAQFYFPHGQPVATSDADKCLYKIKVAFTSLNGRVTKEQLKVISKACGLPLYWKMPLFMAVGGDKLSYITYDRFLNYWKKLTSLCHDDASRFVYILSKGSREYLIEEDFHIMLYDIINTHPGLSFLKDASDFHTRYTTTVIARIFFEVNRSWSGKITIPELRKSNFLQVLSMLEEEEDINQITEYFSYEHFYVIYCKFWNLDTDHDLFINKADLKKHNGGAISTRMIDRIFSGAVKRDYAQKKEKMSYAEFVWFLIAEEDKRHPRSIEYWFRCMDLDGDGYLSMYELEYFYEEQLFTMESLGIETLPFSDCLCQMLDIVRPKNPEKISLSDLKKSKMTPLFFDTFFNFSKYLDHEQKDLFASGKDIDGEQISDWVRYAEEEYQYLVAEENPEQHSKIVIANCGQSAESSLQSKPSSVPSDLDSSFILEDDDYDYADSDPED